MASSLRCGADTRLRGRGARRQEAEVAPRAWTVTQFNDATRIQCCIRAAHLSHLQPQCCDLFGVSCGDSQGIIRLMMSFAARDSQRGDASPTQATRLTATTHVRLSALKADCR